MSQSSTPSEPQAPQPPAFDPNAAHQARPKLRPIRGFPVQATAPDGTQVPMLALSDARQVSDKVVFAQPAAQMLLPLMNGTHDLDQIVAQVGRGLTRSMLEQLVAQLDDAGLLEGPSFDAMLARMRKEFDSSAVLPPASTANFADALLEQANEKDASPQRQDEIIRAGFAKWFDQWIAEVLKDAADPALDKLPKAIVAPHLDYPRGWINYASVYGRLRVVDRPDRVIILGTNHYGLSTGVCGCDKGYQTALGTCEADKDLISSLRASLGEPLFANRYDHEREHSIEMHIPWIQHVFGKDSAGNYPKVFGALIHDPSVKNGESYDGNGVALQPFVDALKKAIAALPGRTLIVSSADLSHAGPSFGDEHPLAGDEQPATEARNIVFKHDQEMLQLLLGRNDEAAKKPADEARRRTSELISAMAWQQNPTRWCSTGNLVAAMLITEPAEVRLLNYSAAMDQQGMTLVSSAAMVMN